MSPQLSFSVTISTSNRPGDFSVNGIPVFRNYSGHRVDVTLPITEYVVPGDNWFHWDLFVENEASILPGATARAIVKFSPFRMRQWQTLTEVAVSGPLRQDVPILAAGSVSPLGAVSPVTAAFDLGTMIASVARSVQLQAAIPAWAWLASSPVEETPEVVTDLIAWYRRLHMALAARDVPFLTAALREKVFELGIAYGLSEADVLAEIGLTAVPFDSDWSLSTPQWDELMMETAADDRLVRLFHPIGGGVIVYRDDTGLYNSFDFWLRQSDQAWVMAR